MSLQDHIKIDTVYTRSINLERDIDSLAIVEAYIPTTKSLQTLRRLSETLNDNDMPRSWALIGPYGSGKSSFAVYLSHLLHDVTEPSAIAAHKSLGECDAETGTVFADYNAGSKGFASVLLTGAPEPLVPRFLASLQDAATAFWQGRRGQRPPIFAEIKAAIQQESISTSDVVKLVEGLRAAIEIINGTGLIIIFDELGKFLEYEARHYEANDIYLLQELAEMTVTGRKANLYVVTLMHQGFEQYARGLGEELRNEWSKIQGRFENILFLESTEQTLRVISKAFSHELTRTQQETIAKICRHAAAVLAQEKALPGSLEEETAAGLFSQCYPLHPVTVLLLPILCQKMAQNERTLFSYLGSKEQHGLRHTLTTITDVSDWVMPWEVFDYFILNQPAVLTDPTTHRRWAEVITAIERLGDAPSKQLHLLKTIGLLNIIGAQAGFKASKAIVSLCTTSKKSTTMTANGLIEATVLQFRKFSNEYRVWQGSDFDLEAAIKDELGQLGQFDLSEQLNQRKPLQPIVARRHTIETGALRYFSPSFVGVDSYKRESPQAEKERIILCLVESSVDLESMKDKVPEYFSDQDVVAICPNGTQLRAAVAEVLALHRVERNCQELHSDPIAQREFKDRLGAAEQLEDELLSALLANPENAIWYWQNKELPITCKRNFQQQSSKVLDIVYCDAPHIHNELINREKPSAQANAARNKLIAAMVHSLEETELGIEKFPPEKAIYLAFLHSTGLHQQNKDGRWALTPPKSNNKNNFYPVWQEIDAFLNSTQETPKSFAEITSMLQAPPFGVKAGVLPLLYLTVFLSNQHELALYEKNVYIPYITDQHIDRFMKRPEVFTVQRLRIHGIRASLFQQYVQVLFGENSQKKASLHAITKPLAKFIFSIEEYTKQTSRISEAGQRVRKAVELAKSPADLLFVKLPKACGFPAIDPNESEEAKIEGFAAALIDVIRELRDCHQNMVLDVQIVMAKALFPDSKKKLELEELRSKTRATFEDLGQYTIDQKGLCPFIEYLAEAKASDELWLNRLLLFLGGRASDKWSDIERDNAVKNLTDLSRRLLDLKFLQSSYQKQQVATGDDFDVIWLRTMRHATNSDCDKLVRVNRSTRIIVQDHKEDFMHLLSELDGDETKLAMLAELVDDLLSKKNEARITGKKNKKSIG